jgi:hypothetical protein
MNYRADMLNYSCLARGLQGYRTLRGTCKTTACRARQKHSPYEARYGHGPRLPLTVGIGFCQTQMCSCLHADLPPGKILVIVLAHWEVLRRPDRLDLRPFRLITIRLSSTDAERTHEHLSFFIPDGQASPAETCSEDN